MSSTNTSANLKALAWLNSITMILTGIATGCWLWLIQNREMLPSRDVRAGKLLFKQYIATSHDVFLAILAISSLGLLFLIQNERLKANKKTGNVKGIPFTSQLINFAKQHPFVLALFAGYTVAMVHQTNWFYPELTGWMQGIANDDLLNNFSIRKDILLEARSRDDYRFFPLAHQDLHVLSWFSNYVGIWMLVNAAELFTIVIMANRFIIKISKQKRTHSLLLMISIIMLFHPAIGTAFFQFTYCERMLTFIFSLYCVSYINHKDNKNQISFYTTLLLAAIGIFIKDIGIILFTLPPFVMLFGGRVGLTNNTNNKIKAKGATLKQWSGEYKLELWLCSLVPIFILFFIILAVIPSAFVNTGAYAKDQGLFINPLFQPDWRLGFLLVFCMVRSVAIGKKKARLILLDALNITALFYAIALIFLVGFESNSYLTLPIQFIIVLDICFAFLAFTETKALSRKSNQNIAAIGAAIGLVIVGIEHIQPKSFYATVKDIKLTQVSWLNGYKAIDAIAIPMKEKGEAINLIYNKNSWFSADRHLNRLRYDRLVEFDPQRNLYSVEAGINKGSVYNPQPKDIFIVIDDTDPEGIIKMIEKWRTTLLYQDNHGQSHGRIYQIKR